MGFAHCPPFNRGQCNACTTNSMRKGICKGHNGKPITIIATHIQMEHSI